MRKISVAIIIITLIGLGYFFRVAIKDLYNDFTKSDLPEPTTYIETRNNNSLANYSNDNVNIVEPVIELPSEINLDVPFTSQAPYANWDLPYQEACEEAAALMVHRYLSDQPFTSKDDADQDILELVSFQESNYGFYKDSTAEETARFIRDKWNYQVEVLTGSDVTIDKIRQYVAQGQPVILLAAGQMLGNPNFTDPGPVYHALVVKGYKKDGTIITNDPGTRNGENYTYNPEILYQAIHDWNDGVVAEGQKNMLIVIPSAE